MSPGCCREPKDPDDPASTKQAKLVETWLDDIVARRDQDALDKLRKWHIPEDWDATRLGQRLDRIGTLREVEDVTWTSARWALAEPNPKSKDPVGDRVLIKCIANAKPPLKMEATLDAGGETHELKLRVIDDDGLKISAVQIDNKSLVPDESPKIHKAPVEEVPPGAVLGEATLESHSVGSARFLRLNSPASVPVNGSIRLQADCQYGDRWYRHSIVGRRQPKPIALSVQLRDEPEQRCSVVARAHDQGVEEVRSWCWTPTSSKPDVCPERPREDARSEAPVFVDNVAPRVADNGYLRIAYDLYPNERLTDPGLSERNQLNVRLRCGTQPVRFVARPLNGEHHPPGLFQSLAALYDDPVSKIDFPCDVHIELVRSSPYERKTWTLFEGCTTKSTIESGACPSD